MVGAATFLNPLIKVITTVAILAAIYFLIVRPIRDTTEGTIESANRSFGEARSGETVQQARAAALSQVHGLRAGSQPWNQAADEVTACVRRAGAEVRALRDCERIADDASHALHDRNFATSYADNLAAQGDVEGAARVSQCVERAGYGPKEMARCRRLADRLLFG